MRVLLAILVSGVVCTVCEAVDLDGNGSVDCGDVALFQAAFGTESGEAAYHAEADRNGDGRVDGIDWVLFLEGFPAGADCVQVLDADRFVPLDTLGTPVEGERVQVDASSGVPPLVFRPGGRNGRGPGQGLNVRLPDGGQWTDAPEGPRLSASAASADFGGGAALQFPSPLAVAGAVDLPVDRVSAEAVAEAFGLGSTDELELMIFDVLPIEWIEGELTIDGLEAFAFRPTLAELPLPSLSGAFPHFALDLNARDRIRIPFYDTFGLPSDTSPIVTLSMSPRNPLWLELEAAGTIRLRGRVDVVFGNGATVRADITLDDPVYRLELYSDEITVPVIASLRETWLGTPPDPPPGGPPDAAALDELATLLRARGELLGELAASVEGMAPVPGGGS